jgi:hypothetical protein
VKQAASAADLHQCALVKGSEGTKQLGNENPEILHSIAPRREHHY